MADVRFDIDQAVKKLQEEAQRAQDSLAERAKALEDELRYIAKTMPSPAAVSFAAPSDALHVFEVFVAGFPADAQLELTCWSNRLGSSRTSHALARGRYRAVLQLVRLPDGEEF